MVVSVDIGIEKYQSARQRCPPEKSGRIALFIKLDVATLINTAYYGCARVERDLACL